MATKNGNLTRDDLRELLELNNEILENRFRDIFVTKEDIKHLPTKDEFYEEMAKVSKRLDDVETDHQVMTGRVSKHSDQIDRLEKHTNLPAIN